MNKLIFAIVFSLFSCNLWAQNLTTQQASNWLDAMQTLEKWGNSHEAELAEVRAQQSASGASLPQNTGMPSFTNYINAAKNMGVYTEVSTLLQPHGFNSLEHWAQVGDKVMKAFMAASFQEQNVDQQLLEQLAALENDPNIPAQQKAMLKQSMTQMQSMMTANNNAPAADIKAIQPLMPRFQTLGQ